MKQNYSLKLILFLSVFTFFITGEVLGQDLSIFDIARKGTLSQLEASVKNDSTIIDKVSKEGYSPLTLACYYSNIDVAKYLIKNVKDINSKSGYGTPLMAATVKSNTELVKLLLEKGANPNFTDVNDSTALHFAVIFNIEPIIKLLIKAGAKSDLKDNRGKTAMDYASINRNQKILLLLKQ